ncbi:MAG: MFS transporter [Dehalococcoidales bacterium]|jgi:EmrB/QacA subfamily drug resistance transporter
MTRYVIFIVSSLSLLIVSISGTSVSVAFPEITAYFNAPLILAAWVLTVNQLASTAVMPLAGKAGDIFGGKRTFLVSIAVFTIGSLFSALAPNIELLIAARFVQAIGAGSFLPLATAIVSDQFPHSRQQAIGFFSSIFPIGMIIGPNIGGWLVEAYGWRSVFWLNLPLGVLVFIFALIIIKPGKTTGGKLDLTGAGLFTGMLSAFLIALSEIGSSPDSTTWTVFGVLLALGGLLLYLFIRHEGKIKEPIIDLQVLKDKPFQAANYFNFLYGMAVLGVMSFIPLYAIAVYEVSTLASGLILTPRSVGTMLASLVTSMMLPKWGYRKPMLFGTGIMFLTNILLGLEFASASFWGIHLNGVWLLGVIMFVSGVGMGIIAPAANNACIELMPHRVATITGVRGMFRQSGSAVSIAVTSLVLENFTHIGQGFRVVFFALAAVLVVAAPFIFAMPRSAAPCPPQEPMKRTL